MRNIWSIVWALKESSFSLVEGVPIYWHLLRTLSHVPHIAGILLAAYDREEQVRDLLQTEPLGVPVRHMPTGYSLAELLPECPAFLGCDCATPFVRAEHIVRLCEALDGAEIAFTKIPPAHATTPFSARRNMANTLTFLPSLPVPEKNTQISLIDEGINRKSMTQIYDPPPVTTLRIGQGYDVHRFGGNRPFVLGGVPIPTDITIEAHSDGDVLLHAIADALLGAAALGDIGDLFPPDDPQFDGISSGILLDRVLLHLKEKGIYPLHADCTVIAQRPKIAPYRAQICANVAGLLGLSRESVNIKATTEEKLGFTGRGEGIKATSVVLCQKMIS